MLCLSLITLIYTSTASAESETSIADKHITMIKQMQQQLLIHQHVNANTVAKFYNKNFMLNNTPQTRTELLKKLVASHSKVKSYSIDYHYFSTSGNDISWYERLTTTNRSGHKQSRDLLELAVVNDHNKITQLYAAGQ